MNLILPRSPSRHSGRRNPIRIASPFHHPKTPVDPKVDGVRHPVAPMAIGNPASECGRKEPLHGRRELAGMLKLDLPIDQGPERLHEVAGEVVGVRLGVMVDSHLVEVALRRDPARRMREKDGIAVVKGVIGRVRVRYPNEAGAEQRLEIAAGPAASRPVESSARTSPA